MKEFRVQFRPFNTAISIKASSFTMTPAPLSGGEHNTLIFYGEDENETVAEFRLSELIGWWEASAGTLVSL